MTSIGYMTAADAMQPALMGAKVVKADGAAAFGFSWDCGMLAQSSVRVGDRKRVSVGAARVGAAPLILLHTENAKIDIEIDTVSCSRRHTPT